MQTTARHLRLPGTKVSVDRRVAYCCLKRSSIRSESWFDRLASVGLTLIAQWVRVLFGFTQPRGKGVEANAASCELLLQQIPTPPPKPNNYVPFQVEVQSLEKW